MMRVIVKNYMNTFYSYANKTVNDFYELFGAVKY